MSWKFVLYDWAGLNLALFQAINAGTPAVLWPLASLFSLIGSYWTAPLTVLGLWAWSKASSDPARVRLVRSRLLHFGVAFLLALAAASALKWWLDFPRPHAVLGAAVRVIGAVELHYSLPSGHATYAALVAAALWPLLAWRGRGCLLMYAALVGWSRMAAGMHFPGDVLAGWGLGLGCTVLSRWLISFATAARAKGLLAPALPWYGVAAAAVAADQAAKLSIERAFVYGKQVEITPFFNLVHVLNPGAAFSFLAGASGWQRYFFITLGLLVAVWLIRQLKQTLPRFEAVGYSLILGGALGNVVDRLLRGQVVDFLDFHWQGMHWPAFNLADVAISIGVGCLIARFLEIRDKGNKGRLLSG